MGSWHSIDITLGPYSWHIVPGDEGELGDVLDGLKVSTAFTDDHPIQGTPGPMTASFGIVVDDVYQTVSANLAIGTPCSIMAYRDAPGAELPSAPGAVQPPLVQLIGRVAELSASPQHNGTTFVQVMVVDVLADLANMTVGTVDYPAELTSLRFERIWLEGPYAISRYALPGGDTLFGIIGAREASPISALELLQQTLASQVDADVYASMFLVPNPSIDYGAAGGGVGPIVFGDELDPVRPFTILYCYKRVILGNAHHPANLPGVLVDGPAGWTVELDPLPGDQCFDGDFVELDTTYSKTKSGQVDRAIVTGPGGGWYQQFEPNVPIEWRYESEQTLQASYVSVAIYALPPRSSGAWGNDKLTILDASLDVPIPWFAAWYVANWNPRSPVQIANVDPAQNPHGRPWIAGMFQNAELTFTDGGWQVDLELRPELPRFYSDYDRDQTADGFFTAEPYLSPRWLSDNRNELDVETASFPTGIGNWTAGGSLPPAIARITAAGSAIGVPHLRVTWQAGGSLPLVQTHKQLLGDNVYTASADVIVDSGPAVCLAAFNAVGGTVFGPASVGAGVQRLHVTFTTAPDLDPGPDLLQIWPTGVPAAGQVFRFRNVKIERGSVATPFAADPTLATLAPADLDPELCCRDLRIVRRPD